MQYTRPFRLTLTTVSQASAVTFSQLRLGTFRPALLINKSIRLCFFSIWAAASFTCSTFSTSRTIWSKAPPWPRIASAALLNTSDRRPEITTCQPSFARLVAPASPMPVPPPVIHAMRFVGLFMMTSLSVWLASLQPGVIDGVKVTPLSGDEPGPVAEVRLVMATKNIPPELRLCELYGASFATGVLPRRVWNGIFAARYRRAKRDLKAMSPRRDRKSETTTREKWPLKFGSIEIQPHFVAWLAADHRIRWQEPSGSLELSHSQAAHAHTLQFVNRHQMLQHFRRFS